MVDKFSQSAPWPTTARPRVHPADWARHLEEHKKRSITVRISIHSSVTFFPYDKAPDISSSSSAMQANKKSDCVGSMPPFEQKFYTFSQKIDAEQRSDLWGSLSVIRFPIRECLHRRHVRPAHLLHACHVQRRKAIHWNPRYSPEKVEVSGELSR